MSALSRVLVVWCLLLTLPAQGMAAALMLACVTGQGAFAGLVDPGHVPDDVSRAHGFAPHAGVAHHHGAADRSAVKRADHESTLIVSPHAADSSCSACAACCLMMHAMPVWFDFGAVPSSHDRIVPVASAPPRSHLPDGLERPPRGSFFA